MSYTFTETVTLEKIECASCAGVFALNETWLDAKRRESGGFICPYCGIKRGWWETEESRLRRQLEEKAKEVTSLRCTIVAKDNAIAAERAQKEISERKLKRVHAGVCPCCNRTFSNLARHMETKHKI